MPKNSLTMTTVSVLFFMNLISVNSTYDDHQGIRG